MTRKRIAYLWKYQIRYRLARRLIYAGLFVMPQGRYKTNLLNAMWDLYDAVVASTAPPPAIVAINNEGAKNV